MFAPEALRGLKEESKTYSNANMFTSYYRSGGYIEDWQAYIKPWYRFGPYAIGMGLGLLMIRTNCKIKVHWVSASFPFF